MLGFDFTFKNEDIKVCVINVSYQDREMDYEYYITDINDNIIKDYYVDSYLEDEIHQRCYKELEALKMDEDAIKYERRYL